MAKKDLVPALAHFRIENGHVRGFNGTIALSSPIALNLACSPRAVPFFEAIRVCDDTVQLHLDEKGRLVVKCGGFTAFIECTEDMFPAIFPEGIEVPIDETFMTTVKVLAPFISEDPTKQWAQGIMFREYSAYATNNLVLIERWLGTKFPAHVNVPKSTVDELIRIDEDPIKLRVSENSISFHYLDGRWLRSSLYSVEWPDTAPIFDRPSKQKPFPYGFFTALEKLKRFVASNKCVYLSEKGISTSATEGTGARVDMLNLPVGVFNIHQLMSLRGIADTVDLSDYPHPCMFFGHNLRGCIVGSVG